MLISLMSMWETKEQVLPEKILTEWFSHFSANNLISLMWTKCNKYGKDCGTNECGINFWETTFTSQA